MAQTQDASASPITVAEAMITIAKVLPRDATLADARRHFQNTHVHMLLIVERGVLLGTLVRHDLRDGAIERRALELATLEGRTVRSDESLVRVRHSMIEAGMRRQAVVDERSRLLGLLCLKRDLSGFCTDSGVAARAVERGLTR